MKRLLILALLAVAAIGTAAASEGALKTLRGSAMSSAEESLMIPEPGFMELAGENKQANKGGGRVSLLATDGTNIEVDYTKDRYHATPVITVYNRAFKGGDKVRVILDSYYVDSYYTFNCTGSRPCGSYSKQELVLNALGEDVYGVMAAPVPTYLPSLVGNGFHLAHSLTVTVNGAKLMESSSGLDKFRFHIVHFDEYRGKASPFVEAAKPPVPLTCTCYGGPGGYPYACAPVTQTCYGGPGGYPYPCQVCPGANTALH
ncbi:MAG: hypothetical protein Q8O90_02310 [Elusimicrobiota bacterium]|nr:hypothetical protein [Elusimicrobiota bacterium]